MEGQNINAQINHSMETVEFGVIMDFSKIEKETGEALEFFLVVHRLKGETSHKSIHIGKHGVINLTILLCADLTNNP